MPDAAFPGLAKQIVVDKTASKASLVIDGEILPWFVMDDIRIDGLAQDEVLVLEVRIPATEIIVKERR